MRVCVCVYVLITLCVCVCVVRRDIDDFNMSLSGTPRHAYDERRHERALVLTGTSAGCVRVIGAGDACFQGDVGSKDKLICNGYVLTNDDLCWYHGREKYKETHRRCSAHEFIKDRDMISLKGLKQFVLEATAANNVRFLGQTIPDSLLTAMGTEVKAREACRANDVKVGALVGIDQMSNPWMHEAVVFLCCSLWCCVYVEWLPVYIVLVLIHVCCSCWDFLVGTRR